MMDKINELLNEATKIDKEVNGESGIEKRERELMEEEERNRYKEAYNILMEYWDSLPDEEKPRIDERLKKLNL